MVDDEADPGKIALRRRLKFSGSASGLIQENLGSVPAGQCLVRRVIVGAGRTSDVPSGVPDSNSNGPAVVAISSLVFSVGVDAFRTV